MFKTIHGEPIVKILNAYPAGPGLVAALEIYVNSAISRSRTQIMDEIASKVCEGLHEGKPSGLKCARCVAAEETVREAISIELDRQRMIEEAARAAK